VKALVKSHAKPGLWLEDIPEPEVGINDVLIRVLRTGICGSDIHIYDWNEWAQQTIPVPMAIGHEFVGEIVEAGSNVNDFQPGELVSGEGTWCAAAAGTVWPVAGIFARTLPAWASIVREVLRN
jgi:threonine 3-dehydrogenase